MFRSLLSAHARAKDFTIDCIINTVLGATPLFMR